MFKKKKYDYDLIVIGSGSGGSVGAHYASSLGKKVAIFEKDAIGGECPNFACVPTKALLHAAHVYETVQESHLFGTSVKGVSLNYPHIKKWKDLAVSRTGASEGVKSFEQDKIHVIKHKAHFVSPYEVEAGDKKYSSHKFIISSGSDVFIPDILGLKEVGYITFRQAIDLTKLPESIFIVGGGAVACEFAQIFSSFGSKVTIAARSSLLSNEDKEVSDLVQALFENRGITVLTGVTVSRVEKKGDKKVVYYKYGGQEQSTIVDEILVATGKTPVVDIGLEKAQVKYDRSGIKVNSYLQTSNKHIFAAGDVVGPYLFTHAAYYQSYIAAHNAFSYMKKRVNYTAVPRCVFISPEVASVGMNEEIAKVKGIKFKKGIAAIAILGRANTSNELDGFVKVLTNHEGVIIGASIIAPAAGEMIHELALAVQLKIKAEVIANMIHAYPTFSEGIKIACSNLE